MSDENGAPMGVTPDPVSELQKRQRDPDFAEIHREMAELAVQNPEGYRVADSDPAEFVWVYDILAPEIRADRKARQERERQEWEAYLKTPKGQEEVRRSIAAKEARLPRRSRFSEEDAWEAEEEREEKFRQWVRDAPDGETNLRRAAKSLGWKRAKREREEE